MGGAATIDSINIYPTLERWKLLDPQGDSEDIYNRYAHITTYLVGGETSFHPGVMADSFTLNLNVEDLQKLKVSYVLSNRELEEMSTDTVSFIKLSKENGYCIYQIQYEL